MLGIRIGIPAVQPVPRNYYKLKDYLHCNGEDSYCIPRDCLGLLKETVAYYSEELISDHFLPIEKI